MINRLSRWAPLVGVGFTICLAVAFFGPTTPDTNDSPAKVAAFYVSHRSGLKVQAYFLGYGAILLVCFIAVLAAYLRRRGTNALSTAAVGGAILLAAAMAIGAGTNLMLADKAAVSSPSTATTLNLINNNGFIVVLAAGVAIMMATIGIAMLATKAFPAWMGWVALVCALGAVTGFLAWFALILTGLWVAVASVMLYQRMDAEETATISLPDGGSASIPMQGQPQASESNARIIP